MKILVDVRVSREPPARVRKTRRLVYLARIAANLSHQVHVTAGESSKADVVAGFFDKAPSRDMFDVLDGVPFGYHYEKPDLILCSSSMVQEHVRNDRPIVAFAESLRYVDYPAVADRCAMLVCFACYPEHFWNQKDRPVLTVGQRQLLERKTFIVPWIPHEATLSAMHADGLAEAYCRDDVIAIREMYASPKSIDIGFYGHWEPRNRSSLCNELSTDPRLTIIRTSGELGNFMTGGDYLRWLSSCRLSLNLPGDTMACSRFSEAVMLGVPSVCKVGQLAIDPPISEENCVMVDLFADVGKMVSKLSTVDAIAENATVAYKSGWSLKGQLETILRRLGVR